MLPLVNPKYDPILNGRYLAPILPLGLIWVGLALEWLVGAPSPCPPTMGALRFAGSPRPPPPPSGDGEPVGCCEVRQRGRRRRGRDSSNEPRGRLARGADPLLNNVRENASPAKSVSSTWPGRPRRLASGPAVVLDQRLDKVALGPGDDILRVLRTTLELEGVDVQNVARQDPTGRVAKGNSSSLASRSKPQFTQEAVTALGLQTGAAARRRRNRRHRGTECIASGRSGGDRERGLPARTKAGQPGLGPRRPRIAAYRRRPTRPTGRSLPRQKHEGHHVSAIRWWQRPVPTLRHLLGELLVHRRAAGAGAGRAAAVPLGTSPRFTDETAEARIGIKIAAGEVFPLTNRDPYIGSLWNYVLAAGFAIGGASLFTPRTISGCSAR